MISITTPASNTPIIRIINEEKLPMVSVVVEAIELVKLSGNAINVSIIGLSRRFFGVNSPIWSYFNPIF
jgi:hypothetical protein